MFAATREPYVLLICDGILYTAKKARKTSGNCSTYFVAFHVWKAASFVHKSLIFELKQLCFALTTYDRNETDVK